MQFLLLVIQRVLSSHTFPSAKVPLLVPVPLISPVCPGKSKGRENGGRCERMRAERKESNDRVR